MLKEHKDRDGNRCLIAAMDNDHLTNYVVLRCKEVHRVMNTKVALKDPRMAALYRVNIPTPEEAGAKAAGMVEQLYPYLSEALLRGGEVAAICSGAIRLALGRDAGLETGLTFEQLTAPEAR